MCIMFTATKKQGLPDDSTLQRIFAHNPDGGGMAAVFHDKDSGKLRLASEKGLMLYPDFLREAKAFFAMLTDDSDYIIAHTRIATSGGKTPEKTHPFKMKGGGYIFHNGVVGRVSAEPDFDTMQQSDTEWVASHYENDDWLSKYDGSSRFAIIHPDGTLKLLGDWKTDDQGRKWSNGGYEERPAPNYYLGNSQFYGRQFENGYPSDYGSGQKSGYSCKDKRAAALFEILKMTFQAKTLEIDSLLAEYGIKYDPSNDLFFRGSRTVTIDCPFGKKGYLCTSDDAIFEPHDSTVEYSEKMQCNEGTEEKPILTYFWYVYFASYAAFCRKTLFESKADAKIIFERPGEGRIPITHIGMPTGAYVSALNAPILESSVNCYLDSIFSSRPIPSIPYRAKILPDSFAIDTVTRFSDMPEKKIAQAIYLPSPKDMDALQRKLDETLGSANVASVISLGLDSDLGQGRTEIQVYGDEVTFKTKNKSFLFFNIKDKGVIDIEALAGRIVDWAIDDDLPFYTNPDDLGGRKA